MLGAASKPLNANTRSCDHSCMPQIAGRFCNLAPSWTAESTSDTLPRTIKYEIAVNGNTVPKKSDAEGIKSSMIDHPLLLSAWLVCRSHV